MKPITRDFRTGALAAILLASLLGACNSLLEVDNPGAISGNDLNTPANTSLLVNSVVGEFQSMYADLAYYGAILTDEIITGHNFETIQQIDLRVMDPANGTLNAGIYQPLQEARFAADSISGRLRNLLPNPGQDSRLATTLVYAGYTYVLLGEYFCEAPVDVNGAPGPMLSDEELLQRGLDRFNEAIGIATAAEAAGEGAAVVDPILNLARVGAARAALQLGDLAKAMEYASQVPADFEFLADYSDNSPPQYNPFYGASTGSNQNLGVDPEFMNLNDPRVRHTAKGILGHNRSTVLFRPYQPPSFSGWTPTDTAAFEKSTDIRFASGLEARYIVAEAQGPTPATLAFVNERRAVGTQPPLPPDATADEIMAALREQRSRDFYLDGHRLGDLRRYIATGVGNFFPTGQHPNPLFGTYGTATCFVVTSNETTGNPNL